jgi:hypothetical protein
MLLVALVCPPLLAVDDLPWDTSPSTAWPAGPGQARIEIRGDYLKDFGLDVVYRSQTRNERSTTPARVEGGRLWAWVPYGNFEAFNGGRLSVTTDLVLSHGSLTADFRNLTLIPSEENKSVQLQVLGDQGQHLATITHIHAIADAKDGVLTLHNADVRGSRWLASQLGVPALEGMPIGMMWLDLAMDVPLGADISGTTPDRGGLSCEGRPFWPQDNPTRPEGSPEYLVDVRMETLSNVAYQGRQGGTGRIKVAPSATLKNVAYGDAVWVPKFSSISEYTYEPRDQHPFLVWNMYRIDSGRIEQLGASGVKHAFLTLNFNCTVNCQNGRILWPGCEDVYSSGTNDSNSNQGPREDILAADGLFFSSPSFFDPGGVGSQTNNSGSFENRLMINETDLGVVGADYFLDAWYVVMHDIDIWNSMGYHSINPSPSGSAWTFGPLGPFVRDTPLTEWIPFPATEPNESHVSVVVDGPTPEAVYPANQPDGHFRVLARAEDQGDGTWLYRYAVMNFDFDLGLSQFEIPLPEGAVVSNTFMGGPYDVLTTPWNVTIDDSTARFTAPSGDKLPWFTLYNFEITVDRPPAAGASVALTPFSDGGGRPRADHIPGLFVVEAIAPAAFQGAEIFVDRFESD